MKQIKYLFVIMTVLVLFSCTKYEPIGKGNPIELASDDISLQTSKDGWLVKAEIPAEGLTFTIFLNVNILDKEYLQTAISQNITTSDDYKMILYPEEYETKPFVVDWDWGNVVYPEETGDTTLTFTIAPNTTGSERAVYCDIMHRNDRVCLDLIQSSLN